MPSVSAIISAYYHDGYLGRRLENLAAQRPSPAIILVCQQKSAEHVIALDYQSRLDNLTIITTADIPTVYGAWNIALNTCDSDYVTNANCDDEHYSGALATLASCLDQNPDAAVAYADSDIVDAAPPFPNRFNWSVGGFATLLHTGCFLGPMPMWRRSLHDRYGQFDESLKVAGDYEFWLRIAAEGEKFCKFSDKTLGVYRYRDNSRERRHPARTL
jgi:hypothetical protein